MENKQTANPPFDRRLRVLIVEDSERMRENLTKVLSVLPHFEIVGEAKDGLKAIEAVRNLAPAVIHLDMTGEFYRKRCRDLSAHHFFDKITEFNQFVEPLETM